MIMYLNFEIVQLLPNLYLHIILSTLFIFHSRFFLGVMDITQQGIVTLLELWIKQGNCNSFPGKSCASSI